MSYYLDVANAIKKDNPEAARVIEELYAAKVELEKTVKRISDARDLLLKEEEDKHQELDYIDGMAGAHKVTLVGADPYF